MSILHQIILGVLIIGGIVLGVNCLRCHMYNKDKGNLILGIIAIINVVLVIVSFSINRESYKEYEIIDVISDNDVYIDNSEVISGKYTFNKDKVYFYDSQSFNKINCIVGVKCYLLSGRLSDSYNIIILNSAKKSELEALGILSASNVNTDVTLNKIIMNMNHKDSDKNSYDNSIKALVNNSEDTKEKDLSLSELNDRLIAQNAKIIVQQEEINELRKEINTLRSQLRDIGTNKVTQLKIDNIGLILTVVLLTALSLIGLFIYKCIIEIRTRSKKELIQVASDVKIREGVMLDNKSEDITK